MVSPDDARKAIGCGGIGFGVLAVVSPRAFLGLYGVPDEPNLRLMARLWGTRNTLLGVLTFLVRDTDDRQTLLTGAAALDALDTLLIAASHVPTRARVMGAATTAAFSGATAYAATK